jgi:hypothetical protein
VVLALALATAAGNLAGCAGWQPSAEARMACCADEAACPMHGAGGGDRNAGRHISQTDADACCASSEGDDGNLSSTYVLPAAESLTTLPAGECGPAVQTAVRRREPLPPRSVPRHLLLSILLV